MTVLDCGVRQVTCEVFRRRGGRLVGERTVSHALPGNAITESEWVEQVAAAFGALKAHAGPVVLVLPASRLLLKMLTVPDAVAPRQREKIVRFEAEQSLPLAWSEMVWGSVAAGGNRELLVMAKQTVVERLCAAAESAGFEPQAVWPAPLAAWAGFRRAVPAPQQPTLIVWPGEGDLTVGLAAGEHWALRCIVGGESGDWRREINRTRRYFEHELGLPPAAQLAWVGADRERAGQIAEQLGLPLEGGDTELEGNRMSGAAALSFGEGSPRVDLLPPARRAARERRRCQPWWAAAAILVLVALVPPVIEAHAERSHLREQMIVLENEMELWRAGAARQRETLARLESVRREMELWQEVAGQHTHWLRVLADWQERLARTDAAWLEKLQPVAGDSGEVSPRLLVAGCVLDRDQPLSKGSPAVIARVQRLVADLRASPFVTAVATERYDTTHAGLLRFELVLVMNEGGRAL